MFCFQQHTMSKLVVKISVAGVLALLWLGTTFRMHATHAQSVCASGDRTYIVVSGDTLSGIAYRYGTTSWNLASYNHIANPNRIFVNQVVCIPGSNWSSTLVNTSAPPVGTYNSFPYPQCTWWADERYHQLHGVYVPWRTQANAWQWTARAYQFGWHVSRWPQRGDIIVLQSWVQGAYGLGHVAVVEQILSNGQVLTSNLNWGEYREQVTYVRFTPGSGVTFIHW